MKMSQPIHAAMLVASMNSFALDYVARQSVGGTHLNFFILKQLPVPEPGAFFSLCGWHLGISRADWILPRVLELTYTAIDMEGFALDIGYHGQPFQWDDERRFGIRAELDAALFHIYGLERDDVDYIMETFPIVKRKDIAAHGSYRTKEAILRIYDEIADAMANGTSYQTHLDPPPANGWVPPILTELEDGTRVTQADGSASKAKAATPGSAVRTTVPNELDVNLFSSMAYPSSAVDQTICAAALSIVEQSGSISSREHLDALLLCTHPDWCKPFLTKADQDSFQNVLLTAPSELIVSQGQSIRWTECRTYLEQLGGILIDRSDSAQPIRPTSNAPAAKAALPSGTEAVVRYTLKALDRIRELRAAPTPPNLSDAERMVLQAFDAQHREYQLVG